MATRIALLPLLLLCFFLLGNVVSEEEGFVCKQQQEGCLLGGSSTLHEIDGKNIILCHNCRHKIQHDDTDNEIICFTENSSSSKYKFRFSLDAVPSCDDQPMEETFPTTTTRGIMCKASSSGCPLGIESKQINGQSVCHNCRYRINYDANTDTDKIKCYIENSMDGLYPFLLGAIPGCDGAPTEPSFPIPTTNGMMCKASPSLGCPLGVEAVQVVADGEYVCHNCHHKVAYDSGSNKIKCYIKDSLDGLYPFLLGALPNCDNAPTKPSFPIPTTNGMMCKASLLGCPLGVNAVQVVVDGEYVCHNCHHKVAYDSSSNKIKCYIDDSLDGLYPFLLGALPNCDNAPTKPSFPIPTTNGIMCKASSLGCPLGVESIRINEQFYCHNCHHTIKYDADTDKLKCYTENASSKLYPFLLGALPDCKNVPTEPLFPISTTNGLMCKASSLGCPLGVDAVQIDGEYVCHNCHEAVEYDSGDPGEIKCRTQKYSESVHSFFLCALPNCDNVPPASSFSNPTTNGIMCKASTSFGCPLGIDSIEREDQLVCHNCCYSIRQDTFDQNKIQCYPTSTSSMSTFYLDAMPPCYSYSYDDNDNDEQQPLSFPYCTPGTSLPSSCTRSCFSQSGCLSCPGKCRYNSGEGGCLECGDWTPTNQQCSQIDDDDDEPTTGQPVSEPTTGQPVFDPEDSTRQPVFDPEDSTRQPVLDPEDSTRQPVSGPSSTIPKDNKDCSNACSSQSGCPSCNDDCRYDYDSSTCLQCGDWTPSNQQCSNKEGKSGSSSKFKNTTTTLLLLFSVVFWFMI